MSRLLITGPGHSGGNWVTEICRSTGVYNFTDVIEDRSIMYRPKLYDGYATKITTDFPGINWISFSNLLSMYEDLKIIFTFRHPLDNCLSKIVRGMPMEGNEPFKDLIEFSYEATMDGSVKSIEYAFLTLNTLGLTEFSDRVTSVRLESLINNEKSVVEYICDFIGIDYKDEFLGGYERTNNKWQIKRYDGKLDTSQIDMYKRWDTIYNGFYKNRRDIIDRIATLCMPYIKLLGYQYGG
jgi:hypothetical protein